MIEITTSRHNIDDERKAMKDACDLWMKSIGESRKFMGGDRPNLADIVSLFGFSCLSFS